LGNASCSKLQAKNLPLAFAFSTEMLKDQGVKLFLKPA